MVFEAIEHNGERHGVITRVAAQLGVYPRDIVGGQDIDQLLSSAQRGQRPREHMESVGSSTAFSPRSQSREELVG